MKLLLVSNIFMFVVGSQATGDTYPKPLPTTTIPPTSPLTTSPPPSESPCDKLKDTVLYINNLHQETQVELFVTLYATLNVAIKNDEDELNATRNYLIQKGSQASGPNATECNKELLAHFDELPSPNFNCCIPGAECAPASASSNSIGFLLVRVSSLCRYCNGNNTCLDEEILKVKAVADSLKVKFDEQVAQAKSEALECIEKRKEAQSVGFEIIDEYLDVCLSEGPLNP